MYYFCRGPKFTSMYPQGSSELPSAPAPVGPVPFFRLCEPCTHRHTHTYIYTDHRRIHTETTIIKTYKFCIFKMKHQFLFFFSKNKNNLKQRFLLDLLCKIHHGLKVCFLYFIAYIEYIRCKNNIEKKTPFLSNLHKLDKCF